METCRHTGKQTSHKGGESEAFSANMPCSFCSLRLFTNLEAIAGDRVLERILLPIFKFIMLIKRQKPSEAPKAFGAENERKYSISCVPINEFMNNVGYKLSTLNFLNTDRAASFICASLSLSAACLR